MHENMSFTKEMRKATRDVHALSDSLVNAKLLFALSNNAVWAEGLTVFYDIFRYLEEAVKRHPNEYLGRLFVEGMERTKSFESDLQFYLGEDWIACYSVRDEVAAYLLHLQNLEGKDSDILMAYVYHLYLGLLSGGQILTRKRQIKDKLTNRQTTEGYAITNFGEMKISELKTALKKNMEDIASELSAEKRDLLIKESRKVFELNNTIIKTVRGAGRAVAETLAVIVSFCLILYLLYSYLF